MRLLQQPRQRHLQLYRPEANFLRWYGRAVDPRERAVIATLEDRRFTRHCSPRVLIVDPPDFDSTHILKAYLRYLGHINPGNRHRTLIVDGTKDAARDFGAGCPGPVLTNSCRGARRMHGHTYHRVILLNIQQYRRDAPFISTTTHRRWNRLLSNMITPLTLRPDNIAVVHWRATPGNPRNRHDEMWVKAVMPYAFSDVPRVWSLIKHFRFKIYLLDKQLNTPRLVEVPLWQGSEPPEVNRPRPAPPKPSPETLHSGGSQLRASPSERTKPLTSVP